MAEPDRIAGALASFQPTDYIRYGGTLRTHLVVSSTRRNPEDVCCDKDVMVNDIATHSFSFWETTRVPRSPTLLIDDG